MKSVALVSLVSVCCFMILPTESAYWASTGLIGRKVFYAAPQNTTLNWWNAQKLCRSLGFELASIESAAESLAINNLLLERYGTQNVYHWTSGSDRGRTANSFAWFSNGRPVNAYTNWYPGEPTNSGSIEDFIHVGHQTLASGTKYVWNDLAETHEVSALCELDLTSLPAVGSELTYFVETTKQVNWYEAARACAQRGMRLASIESAKEAELLTATVRAYGFTDMTSYWTSGTDNGQAVNSFYWFSTGRPLSYTAWYAGEPNNVGSNENCLHVRVSATGDSNWNDYKCDGELNFVCEVRA